MSTLLQDARGVTRLLAIERLDPEVALDCVEDGYALRRLREALPVPLYVTVMSPQLPDDTTWTVTIDGWTEEVTIDDVMGYDAVGEYDGDSLADAADSAYAVLKARVA